MFSGTLVTDAVTKNDVERLSPMSQEIVDKLKVLVSSSGPSARVRMGELGAEAVDESIRQKRWELSSERLSVFGSRLMAAGQLACCR